MITNDTDIDNYFNHYFARAAENIFHPVLQEETL